MYKKHYGFKEHPFALTPDPAFLYLSKQHKLALNLLQFAIESEAGVSLITGEVGSGKTTVIRKFLQQLDENFKVGLITNVHDSFGDLLQWILMAFDIQSDQMNKASRYKLLVDFLVKQYSENKRTILIIDEAQNMDIQTLEELRLLSNINVDKHFMLQLILVGQPELLNIMQKRELRQFAQRVSVDYSLSNLNYKETLDYIKHRLQVAGVTTRIFDKHTMGVIFYHSNGIPRLINTLCDFALVYGFAENRRHVNLNLMLDVLRDKQKGGIFPVVTHENNEQAEIRQLIKHTKKVDILPEARITQAKNTLFKM